MSAQPGQYRSSRCDRQLIPQPNRTRHVTPPPFHRSEGGGGAINPVAGAIIAGAFLGDRCSPMSSSAHLVAGITHTSLYTNLRNMIISSLLPLTISVAFYTALALFYPVTLTASPITAELPSAFNLAPVTLLPAIAMLLLAILKVDVKLAMLVSIGTGCAIARTLQHHSFHSILQFILFGYRHPQSTPLSAILLGGGLLPMAKSTFVVLISTAFAGIFAGSQALSFLNNWLSRARSRQQLTRSTLIVSVLANMFGCTQTIAIVLTEQVMKSHYASLPSSQPEKSSNEQLALDIENTAVVIAPLIPWNIASLIPTTVLAVGPGFIPYAIYLLLLPLSASVQTHFSTKNGSRKSVRFLKPTLK